MTSWSFLIAVMLRASATSDWASNAYVFEYLAAYRGGRSNGCSWGKTLLLWWALEALHQEGKLFSSETLWTRIKECPYLPIQKNPTLYERSNSTNESIWINSPDRIQDNLKGKIEVCPQMTDEFVDLRVHVDNSLSEQERWSNSQPNVPSHRRIYQLS